MCQEKGLHQIPELPDGTEMLYMSYNEIQDIPMRGLEKLQVGNIVQQNEVAMWLVGWTLPPA